MDIYNTAQPGDAIYAKRYRNDRRRLVGRVPKHPTFENYEAAFEEASVIFAKEDGKAFASVEEIEAYLAHEGLVLVRTSRTDYTLINGYNQDYFIPGSE